MAVICSDGQFRSARWAYCPIRGFIPSGYSIYIPIFCPSIISFALKEVLESYNISVVIASGLLRFQGRLGCYILPSKVKVFFFSVQILCLWRDNFLSYSFELSLFTSMKAYTCVILFLFELLLLVSVTQVTILV